MGVVVSQGGVRWGGSPGVAHPAAGVAVCKGVMIDSSLATRLPQRTSFTCIHLIPATILTGEVLIFPFSEEGSQSGSEKFRVSCGIKHLVVTEPGLKSRALVCKPFVPSLYLAKPEQRLGRWGGRALPRGPGARPRAAPYPCSLPSSLEGDSDIQCVL